jgi:hypothetical protein
MSSDFLRQSWGWNSAVGYWTMKPDILIAKPFDDSLIQGPMLQLLCHEELHHDERKYLVTQYKLSTTEVVTTGHGPQHKLDA